MQRVLPPTTCSSLADYVEMGGGRALESARAVPPEAILDEIEASGLRGRGGAGLPTGRKWRSVAEFASDDMTAVVDERFRDKQPDWTYDEVWSGKDPVERLTDHRDHRSA